MALSTLNPQTVVHDITIAAASYKTIFNSTRIRCTIPQLDATVYSNEAVGDFIGGVQRLSMDFGGVLKKGSAISGPLIPLPQGVAFIVQFDTGCTITGNCNFTDGDVNRPAGQLGTITASAFSIGAFVVTWVTT